MAPTVVGRKSKPPHNPQRYDCGFVKTVLYGANVVQMLGVSSAWDKFSRGVATNIATAINNVTTPA